jgi:hypothetical protein
MVLDSWRVGIGFVQRFQNLDGFLALAFGQPRLSLHGTAINILRIAAEDVLEKRECFVIPIFAQGQLGEVESPGQIIRGLSRKFTKNFEFLSGTVHIPL